MDRDEHKKRDNIDFIFEVMRMKFEHLNDATNALDNKIAVIIGFLATIFAGLVAFFNQYITPCFNSFTLGLTAFLFALTLCVVAVATKKFHYPPNADDLYSEDSLNMDTSDLKSQTIADIKKCFEENHVIHEKKAKLFNFSLWLLVAGTILVGAQFL
jgi:hypothetical protein